MRCKRNIIILMLTIFVLFGMAGAYASDVNDTTIANADTGLTDLSQSTEIVTDELETSEEDSPLISQGIAGEPENETIWDTIAAGSGGSQDLEIGISSPKVIPITDDNYNTYFDENGTIRDNANISAGDTLIFENINNKVFNIDRTLALDSTGKVLNNITIIFNKSSDYSSVAKLVINNTDSFTPIEVFNATDISISSNYFSIYSSKNYDSMNAIDAALANNLRVLGNTITYIGREEDPLYNHHIVIDIEKSHGVLINDNNIILGVESNATVKNRAINVLNSDSLVLSNNNITARIPALSMDWASGEIFSQGVFLEGCDNAVLNNNTIAIQSDNHIGDYGSIYVVGISGDNATIIGNRLGVLDAPFAYSLVVYGENFNITKNMLYTGQNGKYAYGIDVDAPSTGVIDTNLIYAIADVFAYGIYEVNWDGDIKVNVTDNYIYCDANSDFAICLKGSESLVMGNNISVEGNFTTGITSIADNLLVIGNTIMAKGSNVGTPIEYDQWGVATIGIHIISGDAVVTNNTVYTTSKYAVDFDGEGQVTGNELYADLLTGDFAVDYNQNGNVTVAGNIPEMILDYMLTNDTFCIYFDDEGLIREQITCDNLTFMGNFSNQGDFIIINKPVSLLSDNAVVDNIGIIISSDNVSLDGFNFIGQYSGVAVLSCDNVQIINSKFTVIYSMEFNDTCIAIAVLNSTNVLIDNNTIVFGIEVNNNHMAHKPILARNSDGLIISGNNISASLIALPIHPTTFQVYSEGVTLFDCDNLIFENNIVGVKCGDQIDENSSIIGVSIDGHNATVIGNELGVIGSPLGNTLYICGDNFNITRNMIYIGQNGTDLNGIQVYNSSSGTIDTNIIYAFSKLFADGIYVLDSGDGEINIVNNYIQSDGKDSLGIGMEECKALVENNNILVQGNMAFGILSIRGNLTLTDNKIIANGGQDSRGIETSGAYISQGSATITKNNITSTGKYSVNILAGGSVVENYLVSDAYMGDDSVNYTPGQAIVKDNTPKMSIEINAENIVAFFNENVTSYVNVTQGQKPLGDMLIGLVIGNDSYTNTTDKNGVAVFNLGKFRAGNYSFTITSLNSTYVPVTETFNLTVNKLTTQLTATKVTTTFNVKKYLVITLTDSENNPLSGVDVAVTIKGTKNFTTDKNGQIMISTRSLAPKTYDAKIRFAGNENYTESSTATKIVIKKGDSKVTAKPKVFYDTDKYKKYTVVLKDNTGAAIKNALVAMKVNGKLYYAKTNSNGQATFYLKGLTKIGTFKASFYYAGSKYYNKVSAKVNIAVKTAFKTVSKGSKDTATVAKIQRALKSNGYYLTYKGSYLMVDGVYGDCTQRSVWEYQSDNGIKPTGSVDYTTAKKLKIV